MVSRLEEEKEEKEEEEEEEEEREDLEIRGCRNKPTGMREK